MFFRKKKRIEELEKEIEYLKMHKEAKVIARDEINIERVQSSVRFSNLEDTYLDDEVLKEILCKRCFEEIERNIDKYAEIEATRWTDGTKYKMHINICKIQTQKSKEIKE